MSESINELLKEYLVKNKELIEDKNIFKLIEYENIKYFLIKKRIGYSIYEVLKIRAKLFPLLNKMEKQGEYKPTGYVLFATEGWGFETHSNKIFKTKEEAIKYLPKVQEDYNIPASNIMIIGI